MVEITRLAVATVALVLIGCSGGGDSSSEGSTSTPPQSSQASDLDRTPTVKGPDVDNDGIRDDIASRINALPLSPAQKAPLLNYAAAIQSSYDTANTDDAINQAMTRIQQAVVCSAEKINDYEQYIREIKANTLNTEMRVNAYIEFESKLAGRSFSLPDTASCA
jgi:hypothetical protein